MPIELPRETFDEAVAAIQYFSENQMDERMGNIAAGALLHFILEEIGPTIYNKAVSDARDFLQTRVMDLDLEVHENEFPNTRSRR
jgi:uncharacterized protein (DUF2164 family)